MGGPQPGEAERKLLRLVGTWRGTDRMEPSPWVPELTTAEGLTECRSAAGGFTVTAHYEQTKDGQVTYAGNGVYFHDRKAGCFRLHWWDGMGGGCEVFSGEFEGELLVLSSRGPMGQMRITSDYGTEGELHSKMEMSPDGSAWTLMSSGVYRRV